MLFPRYCVSSCDEVNSVQRLQKILDDRVMGDPSAYENSQGDRVEKGTSSDSQAHRRDRRLRFALMLPRRAENTRNTSDPGLARPK